MVGCEIRGEFVEVWFRNRLGNAQQFLPYRANLLGLGGAATLAATFWGSGTRGGSCAHDGWNYSGESLRCLRVAKEMFPFLTPFLMQGDRLPFTARIERPPLYRGGSASKKNGLPTPSHHSDAARCASTEDHQAPSPPLFREHRTNEDEEKWSGVFPRSWAAVEETS